MTTTASTLDIRAIAIYNHARIYHKAANDLLSIAASDPKFQSGVLSLDPIYFLYFHTVELALKAFRRAHSLPELKNHNIEKILPRLHQARFSSSTQ